MMLGWQIAAYWAAGLLVAAGVLWRLRPQGRIGVAAIAIVRECGIVLGLFAFWQLAGTMAHHNPDGAAGRGQRVLDVESTLHIASEHDINHWMDHHSLLTQGANAFYVYGHFNGLILFLAWVFLRHRSFYSRVRMSVVLVTATCFLFHLASTVAPPRLLPGAGFGLRPDHAAGCRPAVRVPVGARGMGGDRGLLGLADQPVALGLGGPRPLRRDLARRRRHRQPLLGRRHPRSRHLRRLPGRAGRGARPGARSPVAPR
jgi:hypothetical protein